MDRLFKSINMYNQYIKFIIPSLKSDIYLIKWLPHSKTKIHNHKGRNCNFLLLKGSLTETRYLKNNTTETNVIHPLQINFINDEIGKHELINNDNTIQWSLHRYS